MMSGVVTLAAFVSFIGIAAWAWSRHNRARFDAASRLPLEDDGTTPACCRRGDRS
jgi:cytochrome c oxidase cbb3-type subunit IV